MSSVGPQTQNRVGIVIPTVGRTSLRRLLEGLAAQQLTCPVIVVDDRRTADDFALAPLDLSEIKLPGLTSVRSGGRGPAAARNAGWRECRTSWVCFLDDDVEPDAVWATALESDLDLAEARGWVGIQGRIEVPLPPDRRPNDWERVTAGLASSRWITADMAYRRDVLARVGGFDERFPRAFREDSDLALRVIGCGGQLGIGQRLVYHPVRPARYWVSVTTQAGNRDDPLMRRLHGADWRARAGAPAGRRSRHLATVAVAAVTVGSVAARQWRLAAAAGLMWTALVGEFATARIRPGNRDRTEIAKMLLTSVAIPPVAVWHSATGWLAARRPPPWRGRPELVLFDRDGTLIDDVPYNGDPELVTARPGAVDAVSQLRAAGIRVGMITNQSGVARKLLTPAQAHAVNARVAELVGGFDCVLMCPHGPDDGCSCRKPAAGMILDACAQLGLSPAGCVVIGDIGSDVAAAANAGAAAILVPTPITREAEIAAAPAVAPTVAAAVDLVLAGAW